MKKLLLGLVVMIVALVGFVSEAAAQTIESTSGTEKTCSLWTVRGPYGAISSGHVGLPLQPTPVMAVSKAVFDGAGKVSGVSTEVTTGYSFKNVLFEGTYTVNPDCTGSLSIVDHLPYGDEPHFADFVLVSGGKEILFVFTDHPDHVYSGSMKRM